jgi:hypothetical protein
MIQVQPLNATHHIDFDALDASYIQGMEFCFYTSLANIDPFQPQLTMEEISALVVGDCGTNWPLTAISGRIDEYWTADDDC